MSARPHEFFDHTGGNDTLTEPDKIEESTKGRKNAFKHIGDKWLKVTFKEEDGAKVVVTVINKNE